MKWKHLPILMSEGVAFYEGVAKDKAQKRDAAQDKAGRKRPKGHLSRLKFREPW